MKNKALLRLVLCLACSFAFNAVADTILMANSRTLTGTVIQTNGDDVLILTKNAAFNFSKASIKGIKPDAGTTSLPDAGRLPDLQRAVSFLSKQAWATSLTPIPATVIDKGILRNVPYSSFRCGGDYELNIYGDLEHPAAIEIGVYRKLLDDDSAKANCAAFIASLLGESADKNVLQELDLKKDLKSRDGMTFEITPPTDEDSYNGWWISVYSEKQLNLARASDDELQQISVAKSQILKQSKVESDDDSWSANDLKQARTPQKTKISFTDKSGNLIKDVEVVRVIDGVSLMWSSMSEDGGSVKSGMVRLEDLPENLRVKFGYDPAKTKAADDLAQANKERWQKEAQATQAAQSAQQVAEAALPQYSSPYNGSSYSSGSSYSGGGRVYVHGYYRKNGTYVNSYTRSAPRRR